MTIAERIELDRKSDKFSEAGKCFIHVEVDKDDCASFVVGDQDCVIGTLAFLVDGVSENSDMTTQEILEAIATVLNINKRIGKGN